MKSLSLLLGAVLSAMSAHAQADLSIVGLDTALVTTDSQTLRISGILRATLTNTGTVATVGRFRILAFEDTNRNSRYDLGSDRILGSLEYPDPISASARPVASIPLSGSVAFRGNLIFVLADSEGALAEITKANNMAHTGESATTPDFTSSLIRKNDGSFPSSVQLTARVGNGGAVTPVVPNPNLLINGSFDDSNPLCPLTFVNRMGTTPPQNTFMPGWTITAGQIDQFGTGYWTTADGRCAVNIDGDFGTSGRLEQVVSTQPGALYEISWQMSGHPGAGLANPLRVLAAGQSADFDFDSSLGTPQNLGWTLYKWQFRAAGTSTTVIFQSLTAERGFFPGLGANIDDVRMVAVTSTGGGANAPVGVSFYRGDPRAGGTLIGRTQTTRGLTPGDFEDISVAWNNPPAGLHAIFVVADDPPQVTKRTIRRPRFCFLALAHFRWSMNSSRVRKPTRWICLGSRFQELRDTTSTGELAPAPVS
jgi:hypothetical protein